MEKTIKEICGSESQINAQDGLISVAVDKKTAEIDVNSLNIKCNDQLLQHLLLSVTQKISNDMMPI